MRLNPKSSVEEILAAVIKAAPFLTLLTYVENVKEESAVFVTLEVRK